MKLVDLFVKQKVSIELIWGEQKIEFVSSVLENDGTAVYVQPYFHNGSELDLNVTQGKGVICNLFTNDPATRKRISWKNIELTTVNRNDVIMYCLKTYGFNYVAKADDRRQHDRIVVQVQAKAFDVQSKDGVNILVHDISDVGISFYAPLSYEPVSQQVVVTFTDYVDGKEFQMRVDCSIARMVNRAGNMFVGCKIVGENKDYQLYGFMKRLRDKNRNKA